MESPDGLKQIYSIPLPSLGPHTSLWMDPVTGDGYMRIEIPAGTPRIGWGCFNQGDRRLCGVPMRRPHKTCLHCNYARVQRGELPEFIPIHLLVTALRQGRRWSRVTDPMCRLMQQLLELFSAY